MRVNDREIISQIDNKERLENRHKQIVQGATRLFSIKGYHKSTMREIAKESQINLSQLYQYITSKDDILYLF